MPLLNLEPDVVVPVVIFTIPMIAIIGGIVSGIVKSVGRQRMLELAQRERIAAIERGVDPSKLPPIPGLDDAAWGGGPDSRSRAQGLMIAGLITLFGGTGILVFLLLMKVGSDGERVWAVGLIPMLVGAALLLSSWLVWPRGNGSRPGA